VHRGSITYAVLTGSTTMAADHADLKAKAKHELKELLFVCGYLWILLASFAMQRTVILAQHGIDMSEIGFAAINALALGKVMLIAKQLHFAHHYQTKPLIWQTLFESAAFSVLLIICKVLEDAIVGMFKGKTFVEGLPTPSGRPMLDALMLGVVLFIALVPFFAFTELDDAMGPGKLTTIFLKDRSKV
jgi:hypothetical protein